MEAVKINPAQITGSSFEFMNRFGIILNNEIVIHQYNRAIPIRLDNLKKIELRKIRKYRRNSLSVMVGMALFMIPFLFRVPYYYIICLYAMGMVSVIAGVFIREYEYRLLIIKKNDFVSLTIDKDAKDDAKSIAVRINKKLKSIKEPSVA